MELSRLTFFSHPKKAVIQLDPSLVRMANIRQAVAAAGYSVPQQNRVNETSGAALGDFSRRMLTALGLAFGAIILLVVAGEWLGLLKGITELVPFPLGAALVLISGSPIFFNVLRAALKRQIIPHTLMTIGAFAAALTLNFGTAMLVAKGRKQNLTLRSAFIHLVRDVLSTAGAVLAGIGLIRSSA